MASSLEGGCWVGKIADEAKSAGGCVFFLLAPLLAGVVAFAFTHMVVVTFMGGWGADFDLVEAIFIAAIGFGSWLAAWIAVNRVG